MTASMGASDPRPAATIVLLRDSEAGVEVLVTVRPAGLRFMGGAAVFPGGAVSPTDLDPRWEAVSALSARDAAMSLDETDEIAALGFFVCALREAHEEVGLSLVRGRGDVPASRAAGGRRARVPLSVETCLENGLILETDRLVPAGRWVTPLGSALRFDARFFLARVPPDWEADPDPHEVEACRWWTPAHALREVADGNLWMAPPTIEMLQRIDGHPNVREACAAMATRKLDGPGSILSARLSPLVTVVIAPNAGPMTGPGTNSYVVGSGPVCVIDPAVDDDAYLDSLLATAGRVDEILITHRHPDHVGGAATVAAATGAPVRAFGDDHVGGARVRSLADGDVVATGGTSLRALHTPGHAPDHVCFLMDDGSSLFSGDNVLGEGTAVIAPPEGDMEQYLASLRRLSSLNVDRVYPGHFRALNRGGAVIDGYLAHRAEREASILGALAGDEATVDEIVTRVYTDTPSALHHIAALSVLAHLEMLERHGRVGRIGERWRLLRAG